MPMCPNCGSYVSEGSPTCSCGTSLGYRSREREIEEDPDKIRRANLADEYYAEARALEREGRYCEAIRMYEKADDLGRRFSDYDRGMIYYRMGDYESALEAFRKYMGRGQDPHMLTRIGRTLTELERYDEALETFFQALGIIEGSSQYVQDYSSPQSGIYYTKEELNEQAADKLRRKRKELAKVYKEIAWTYKFQDNYKVAIKYIDEAIKFDFENSNYWNVKAIILEEMESFEESLECYNQAYEFEDDDIFIENKARMLKRWAQKLYDDDKKLGKAENMVEEAIEIISSIECDEDMVEYVALRSDIRQKLAFKDQKGILKGIGRNNLVTITGTSYFGYPNFEKGALLELVRESENEHDSNAVAVYMDGRKVGYVANTLNSSCNMTTMASNLDIGDSASAKYLMNYMYEFRIARIWRERE